MTNIIIQGIQGRMGRVLCELIGQRDDCRVVGGVDRAPAAGLVPIATSLPELPVRGDVLIDFSCPQATEAALEFCRTAKLPCVICTTGLDERQQTLLVQASKEVAVFQSANMSLGINLLMQLVQKAVQRLGPGYDIEIIEKHHHSKVDAPSGTALLLAGAVNDVAAQPYEYIYDRHAVRQPRAANELGIHTVRGGTIVGEHEVLFCGPDEVLTLSHSASSRTVFANGAVNAALYLAHKGPGLYSMQDLMEG